MKLQTQIPLQPQRHNQIDYHSNLLLLGSCFSENIGNKFNYYKFKNIVNPFGILFHPIAIENLITRAINDDLYQEEDLIFHNERWHCFDAHSSLSADSKEELLLKLNESLQLTHKKIVNATHIIITLGTSWVYRHIESDSMVANCHKVPQKRFLKELLSIDDIQQSLESIIELVKSINPNISFVFTVSPVRHLKDGFVENTQSKSHLIAAIHQVVEPRKRQYYFPAYEVMMDELRDYRFYGEDMIHPNNTAIDYIWECFKSVWIDESASKTVKEIGVIQAGLNHKAFNPESESHQAFLDDLQKKIENIQSQYPHIPF